MRAHTNSTTNLVSHYPDATLAWRERCDQASGPAPGVLAGAALQASLAQEHRDLDEIIAVLSQYSPLDGSLISRLKKRKLHIKDEIARLAGASP
jgi:hypothetical protein